MLSNLLIIIDKSKKGLFQNLILLFIIFITVLLLRSILKIEFQIMNAFGGADVTREVLFIRHLAVGGITSIAGYFFGWKLYCASLNLLQKWIVPSKIDRETKEIVRDIDYAVCGYILTRKWRDLARWDELARWLEDRLEAYSDEKRLLETLQLVVAATKAFSSSLNVHADKAELLEWASRTEAARGELKLICADVMDSLKVPRFRRPKGGLKSFFEHPRSRYKQLFAFMARENLSVHDEGA